MLYLDYAKPIGERYILSFFADKVEDIQEVSNGKSFVTKNGIDYGVPMASSTVIITAPDKIKKTYILGEDGEMTEKNMNWRIILETENILELKSVTSRLLIPTRRFFHLKTRRML